MNKNIILTVSSQGAHGTLVSIETIIRRGLFQFDIIGLANKTISESKQRILSALDSAYDQKRHYINKKITTLLSPADLKKEGSHFDVPIAVSYLIQLYSEKSKISQHKDSEVTVLFSQVIIFGELTLTGYVLPIKDITKLISFGIEQGITHYVIPQGNISDISHIKGIYIWGISHISEMIDIIQQASKQKEFIEKIKENIFKKLSHSTTVNTNSIDRPCENTTYTDTIIRDKSYILDTIEGNDIQKRALEICLSGRHHLLFIGEPGTGKSLIAKAGKEILGAIGEIPSLDLNLFQRRYLIEKDKKGSVSFFREPHHTSSYSEIIGNNAIVGEITLAHRGILFMDELVEFNKRVLESLRQPLEDKYIQKNQGELIPTDFILIACMNPCACGYFKTKNGKCICARSQIERYQRKIHSPLFQRFDICNYVTRKSTIKSNGATLNITVKKITAELIIQNIKRVNQIQTQREATILDSQLGSLRETYIDALHEKEKALLVDTYIISSLQGRVADIYRQAISELSLSKRSASSIARVARTIADLDNSLNIEEKHILEALSFRKI